MDLLTCTGGEITPQEIVDEINKHNTMTNDSNELSGFIRDTPLTMGILEFSPDGTTVYQIDEDGVYSSSTPATFGDGSALAARKFVIYPVAANDLEFYVEGTKVVTTSSFTVTIANTSGLHYIYFSDASTLATGTSFSYDFFEEDPITSLIYWDATGSDCILFGDERHGITMDGFTHRYLHFTSGAKYVSGMGLNTMVASGTTHGQVDSGTYYDEDIFGQPAAQSNLPFWYLSGTTWTDVDADSNLGYVDTGDTNVCYNDENTGTYSLVELSQANDCVIYFILATNNKINPYIKLIGQNSYASVSVARDAINNELSSIITVGLPTPEFVFIAAYIIDGSGELQTLADGATYLDLREIPISAASGASGVVTDHLNLLNIGTNTHAQIDTFITNGVRYDVAGAFSTAQRATFVTTEDNSIAFNSGNNLSFTATGANITVTNQTAGQSGTLVIASAGNITGWGSEFDWGYQGVPTDLAGTETFGYTVSGASGADSIKIGRV